MYKAVIIDDEKWVIRSLRAMIAKNDRDFETVGEAYNGVQGWNLMMQLRPDLAFVDVRMPGMGGLELMQKANETHIPTLFAVISGYAEFAYAQKAIVNRAIGYCLKPFSQSEIDETLQKAKQILGERRLSAPAEQITVQQPFRRGLVKNETVLRMIAYLNENFREEISIQQLADLCSINPNYASQLFSRELGETYTSYLTKLRIGYAAKLLRQTNLTVTQIADKTGYKDYFYFAKVFKKYMGVTPSAYRGDDGAAPGEGQPDEGTRE